MKITLEIDSEELPIASVCGVVPVVISVHDIPSGLRRWTLLAEVEATHAFDLVLATVVDEP